MPAMPPFGALKLALKYLVLSPLGTYGWWCETSARHGCRGQSRHFVREAATTNPFLPFEDIRLSYTDEPIVVDWDGDGDLDVILRSSSKDRDELSLLELKAGKHFVEMEPNPFKGIPGNAVHGNCRPAVVDWDGDGLLDLIVGAEDGGRASPDFWAKQLGEVLVLGWVLVLRQSWLRVRFASLPPFVHWIAFVQCWLDASFGNCCRNTSQLSSLVLIVDCLRLKFNVVSARTESGSIREGMTINSIGDWEQRTPLITSTQTKKYALIFPSKIGTVMAT